MIHGSVYLAVFAAILWRSSITVYSVLGGSILVLVLKAEVAYMLQRAKLPPGDSGLPVFGHLPELMRNPPRFLQRRTQNFGSPNTVNLLMFPCVIVSQDDDVSWMLSNERKGNLASFVLPFAQKLLGTNSIMLQAGPEHRRLRKVFEPAFSPTSIRDYAGAIDQVTQETLQRWCHSGEFVGSREWALLAMRIFFTCAFGTVSEDLMAKLTVLFEGWVAGFATYIPLSYPGGTLAKAHRYKKQLDDLLKTMVNDFKAKNPPPGMRGSAGDTTASTATASSAQRSVLGRLCYSVDDDGNPPSEQVLVDNLRFFLFAGFDTTKATFGALARNLVAHREVYDLLVEEIDGLMANEPTTMDLVDILKAGAPVLNAVLAETWRLAAPLSTHSTRATKDLQFKDYVIPKGTIVSLDIQGYNLTSSKVYPNAAEFRIERWLPKGHPLYDPTWNTSGVDYNVMSPKFRSFNAGPHMCLGSHFAKLEVRFVVARLLQKYNFEVRNEQVRMYPLYQVLNEVKLTDRLQT